MLSILDRNLGKTHTNFPLLIILALFPKGELHYQITDKNGKHFNFHHCFFTSSKRVFVFAMNLIHFFLPPPPPTEKNIFFAQEMFFLFHKYEVVALVKHGHSLVAARMPENFLDFFCDFLLKSKSFLRSWEI